MTSVRVATTLVPKDVERVARTLVLRHPASIAAMSVGPLCLALGLATGSPSYTRFGWALVWLVALVPAFAYLASTNNARRPAAREVYEPAVWTFADESIEIERAGGRSCAEWSEFRKWRSVADTLLLYTTVSRYVVIPWRDVRESDHAALQALLTEHVGRRRR